MRTIPKTMATQHPDNAAVPYWEKNSDGQINISEEVTECMECFKNLSIDEFMWDWEGKFADEAVIDRLFHHHYYYFKKQQLGKNKFLTFRIPNIWQEKGYSLLRSFMVILTCEDFARDLKFHSPPLFEVILPMTETAEQLIFIQKSFRDLARLKSKTLSRLSNNSEYLGVIPLFEGVDNQINISQTLTNYLHLHNKLFKTKPEYLRVFIARSDPAMVSGLPATVLANKIALADLSVFSRKNKIKIFPIIGAGSLPFRGNLNPEQIQNFYLEYPSIATATIQSGFRYDYPQPAVKKALAYISQQRSRRPQTITQKDYRKLIQLIKLFEKHYQVNLGKIIKNLDPVFSAFPKRRERHLHIGLLAYGRKMGKNKLPRAITFTGSLYSIGIPPEFLGIGALTKLNPENFALLNKYYLNYKNHLLRAGKFLNRANLAALSKKSKVWKKLDDDINAAEILLKMKFGPRNKQELEHCKLSSLLFKSKNNHKKTQELIVRTGILRKSLG